MPSRTARIKFTMPVILLAISALTLLALAFLAPGTLLPKIIHAAGETASGIVVIVLNDGTEVTGEIVSETDTRIVMKTSYGQFPLPRSKIKEIRRNVDPAILYRDEWAERWTRLRESKDAKSFLELARWGKEKGLAKEAVLALEKVIQLEPSNEEARLALGHAKLDGQWVDAGRVSELVTQGYQLQGVNLVKAVTSGTAVDPNAVEELEPDAKELGARAKARKRLEKYRREREAEFVGVELGKAWHKKTPHYEIFCDSTERVAFLYMQIMEALHTELSKWFKQEDVRGTDIKLGVRIYKTQQEYMDQPGTPPWSGAYYNPGNEVLYAYHGSFGPTGTTFATLAHEGTHQFQGRKLGGMQMSSNLPRFIAEGMAVYFGDSARLDTKPKIPKVYTGLIPRDRLLSLQRRLEEGTNEKLRDMIMVPMPNGAQYADAWAFVYYLFNGPRKDVGLKVMERIWLMAGQQRVTLKDIETIVEKDFGTIENLDKEIVTYTKTLKPEPTGKIEGDLYSSDEFKISVKRPGEEWQVRQNSENAEVIVYMFKGKENEGPRVDVYLRSKPDPFEKDDEFIKRSTYENKEWNALYELKDKKMQALPILDVYELTYKDKLAAVAAPTPPSPDPTQPSPSGPAPPPPAPAPGANDKPIDQKKARIYRAYWALLPDRAYVVRGSAFEDEFPAFERVFRKVADSLEVRPENRW